MQFRDYIMISILLFVCGSSAQLERQTIQRFSNTASHLPVILEQPRLRREAERNKTYTDFIEVAENRDRNLGTHLVEWLPNRPKSFKRRDRN